MTWRRNRPNGRGIGEAGNSGWARPALRPGHIWSYDFVSLRTEDGRPLRLLNVVDEYTRMVVGFDVARSIGARRVRQVIERLLAEQRSFGRLDRSGAPELIRSGLMIERQGVHLL